MPNRDPAPGNPGQAVVGGPEASDLAAALRGVLGPVTVERLTRLSGGASRETWAFDAVRADGSLAELVLRRDPPGRPSQPGAVSIEARAIGSALEAGLAVPGVLACCDGPDLWGSAGMVMRRIAGETIARRILRDDSYQQARQVLVRQLGEFAAGLHALAPIPDLPAPDPLADLRATLDALQQASGEHSGGFRGVAPPGPAQRGVPGGRPPGPAQRGVPGGRPPGPAQRGVPGGRPPGPAQRGFRARAHRIGS